MRKLVVGGTFNKDGGKPSGLISKMFQGYDEMVIYNGGDYEVLDTALQRVTEFDVVYWFAKAEDDIERKVGKIITLIKEVNPRIILVESKFNSGKYQIQDLIAHMLKNKANLCCEFTPGANGFKMRILDPLGNCYQDYTQDVDIAYMAMSERVAFLAQLCRQRTKFTEDVMATSYPNIDERFMRIITKNADIYHELISPAQTTRFLGNYSFRCKRGFPSFRGSGSMIFVSPRNIDKRYITEDSFVPIQLTDEGYFVEGKVKPSVDTPVQVELYKRYDVSYMLHSHVYVKDAPFTKTKLPCGALEEVKEIVAVIDSAFRPLEKTPINMRINLLGHGSIVLACDLDYLDATEYYAREVPEM